MVTALFHQMATEVDRIPGEEEGRDGTAQDPLMAVTPAPAALLVDLRGAAMVEAEASSKV